MKILNYNEGIISAPSKGYIDRLSTRLKSFIKQNKGLLFLVVSELLLLLFIVRWPGAIGLIFLLSFAALTFDRPELLFSAFIFTLVIDAMFIPGPNYRILFPITAWYSFKLFGTDVYFTDIFIIVIIVQNVLYNVMKGRSLLPSNDLRLPYAAFWVVALISLSMSLFLKHYGLHSFSDFRIVIYSLMLPVTLNIVNNKKKLGLILNTLLLATIPLGLIVMRNLLMTDIFRDIRYSGASHYASGRQSFYLSLAFLFLLIRFLFQKDTKRRWTFWMMVLTGSLVVVAQCRTLYISIPTALALLLILLKGEIKFKYIKILLMFTFVSVALLLFVNIFYSNLLVKRILKSGSGVVNYEEDISGRFRIIAWIQEIEKIKRNPYFGQGFGSAFLYRGPLGELMKGMDPHNSYITIAAKSGLIGLSAFFWIVFAFYKKGIKYLRILPETFLQKEMIFVLVALTDLLVFIGFNVELANCGSGMFIWIFMGIGLFLINYSPNNPVESSLV